MTERKIKFTKKTSKITIKQDVNIDIEIEPISFDTTGFETSPGQVEIKTIKFVDFKDKYQQNGLNALTDPNLSQFELNFDDTKTQFWVIRGHEGDFMDPNKLHISLYTGSNHLCIGSPGGFKTDIITLNSQKNENPSPQTPPSPKKPDQNAEVKIYFAKKNVREISADKLNPGAKGLEIEIKTDSLMSQIVGLGNMGCGGPYEDASWEKFAFVFKDNTNQDIYNSLLASDNQTFELSFDKSKVFLSLDGAANFIDKTKPEVQVNRDAKRIIVFFESKFKDIIKVNALSDSPPKKTPEEISELNSKLRTDIDDNNVDNLVKDIKECDKLGKEISSELKNNKESAEEKLKTLSTQKYQELGESLLEELMNEVERKLTSASEKEKKRTSGKINWIY